MRGLDLYDYPNHGSEHCSHNGGCCVRRLHLYNDARQHFCGVCSQPR